MKFSEKWLREIINPNIDSDLLSHQLTMAGLEVDAVTKACEKFDGLFVADVKSVEKHPHADNLSVCKVDCGNKELLTIVCGAPNVRSGMRTILAKVGAQLPNKPKLKSISLKGIESKGMLCSAKEIGLGEDSEGIIELSSSESVGKSLNHVVDTDDNIFEISLTPNRGDCLNIHGIAREVAAINQMTINPIEMEPVKVTAKAVREVKLSAKQDCPRYVCRIIENIDNQTKPPLWLSEKLRHSGIRSINTVVDITNFVMLEFGQPLHGFDNDKLKGCIEIRFPKGREKIKLLDETIIKINDDTLLIADKSGPLAMAGLMGGYDSAVTKDTKHVLIESAFFKPEIIIGEARQYGLHTDSSHRFERGVDPEQQLLAIERASKLIIELCGGNAGPIIEKKNEEEIPKNTGVLLRKNQIKRMLGINLDEKFISDTFLRLGMSCEHKKNEWIITPPSHRFDIKIEADLIEELTRIYGYDSIPIGFPINNTKIKSENCIQQTINQSREILVNRDYQEVITYSFINPDVHRLLKNNIDPLSLVNPIAPELSEMRSSLLPGLINALQSNVKRRKERVRLFETGLIFEGNEQLNQEYSVGGIIYGNIEQKQWNKVDLSSNFYDIKCDVEVLLNCFTGPKEYEFLESEHSALHPGQAMSVYVNEIEIGYFGQLHPVICSNLGLKKIIFVFELNVERLSIRDNKKYKKVSKFPIIKRDIAVVVDEHITFEEIQKSIMDDASDLLVNLELFDLYRGEGIEKGQKSLALGLTFQSIRSTLKDEDIENNMHSVIKGLSDRLNAKLRE